MWLIYIITTIVESNNIEKENSEEKKACKYERIAYPVACYSIFNNGMYICFKNKILLAFVIRTIIVSIGICNKNNNSI